MPVDISDTLRRIYQDNPKWWPYGLSRDMLDDAHAIVERGSSKTAGFAGWQFRRDPDGRKVGYYAIGVLPEFRGKGYAKSALQQLFKSKPKDVEDVRAYIVPGNVASESLAAKLGVPVVRKSACLQGSQAWHTFTAMKSARASRYVPSHYGGVSLQQYMPLVPRRAELSRDEEAAVADGENQAFPKIFQSMADSPAADMHSPGKGAVMAGLGAGAAVGGGLHYIGGASAPMSGVVGGASGLLSALIAYNAIKAKNEGILEMMRRIPEGGTRRDMESDPVLQANRSRQAESGASQEALRTAQLLAVLEASKKAGSVKQAGPMQFVRSLGSRIAGGLTTAGRGTWAGTKFMAPGAAVSGLIDTLQTHEPGHEVARAKNFTLNTILMGMARGAGRFTAGKAPLKANPKSLANFAAKQRMGEVVAGMTAVPGLFAKDFMQTNMSASKDIADGLNAIAGAQGAAPSTPEAGGLSNGQMLGLGLGAAGIIGGGGYLASKLIDSLKERTQSVDRGRIRVTLPTRRQGDVETQIELPMHEIPLSNSLLGKVQRDFKSRLRAETNARTKKVILSPEEKRRRAELLNRYRLA